MSRTERVLHVLEHLVAASSPPTHAQLMRALEIPRSTLSDVLRDLRELGYVEESGGRYTPGARLLSFAESTASARGLRRGFRPTLERLAAQTRETAVYVISVAGAVVAIDQVESPMTVRYVAEIGQPFPLDRSTAGRAILAFTGEPPADPELAAIRARGYSISSNAGRGTTTMAAPAFDHHSTLVGAVCIIGPRERLSRAELTAWPILRDALADLRGAL